MESNKVKGLIFPVGGEAQAFLADRDRPYRDIREAVQGEYDELGATFADVDIYVNAAGADSLLPNRAINPDAFMDDSASRRLAMRTAPFVSSEHMKRLYRWKLGIKPRHYSLSERVLLHDRRK